MKYTFVFLLSLLITAFSIDSIFFLFLITVELKELKTKISDGNWNFLIADLDLILKKFKVNIGSKETPKRLIIDSIVKCIVRAFEESEKDITVGLEEDLDGKFGHGRADYVLFWLKFMIVLIEAKNEDYIGGVGQLIVEMDCVMGVRAYIRKISNSRSRPIFIIYAALYIYMY